MKKKIQCLLIDDDIDDREIFLMVVEELGDHIRCDTATNGADALEMLKNGQLEKPDFIFLDVNMPKMNGLDCLERLRQIASLKDCRVFMYSTTAEGNVLEKSKGLDAGFIIKPIYPSELKTTLDGILSA